MAVKVRRLIGRRRAHAPPMKAGARGAFVNVAGAVRAHEAAGAQALVAVRAVHTPAAVLARVREALVHIQLTPSTLEGQVSQSVS